MGTTATGTKLDESLFTAYFEHVPGTRRPEIYLKGKMVAEAAARKLLENAAISSMEPKEAVLLLKQYAAQKGIQIGENTQTLLNLVGRLERGEEADQTIALLRTGLLQRNRVPLRNVVQESDREAGDKTKNPAFNIDAPTAEFERDIAAARTLNSKTEVRKIFQELAATVFSCMFGTFGEKRRIVAQKSDSVTFPSSDGGSVPGQAWLSQGAILFCGEDEDVIVPGGGKSTDRPTSQSGDTGNRQPNDLPPVDIVESIFNYGRIPLFSALLNGFYDRWIGKVAKAVDKRKASLLARVEHAREIDLNYNVATVNYGTASTSETFGTGTNVTMLTDAAFICARVLNKLYAKGKFVPRYPNPETWSQSVEYRLDYGSGELKETDVVAKFTADYTTLANEIKTEIKNAYVGHCYVRPGDLGRVLSASLVLQTEIKRIIDKAEKKIAGEQRYFSLKYYTDAETKQTRLLLARRVARDGSGSALSSSDELFSAEEDNDGSDSGSESESESESGSVELKVKEAQKKKAVASFYHKIWSRELGNHAVAQGGARLSESHMIEPFLVRVTSDSDGVVPTLCAFDDWIGPTEQFYRIEQTCIMELENYCHSRPAAKYLKGGRRLAIDDVGAWIRTYDGSIPLTFRAIIAQTKESFQEQAATCCAMLMEAVHTHTVYTDDARKGGLARQRASETTLRTLSERVSKMPQRDF